MQEINSLQDFKLEVIMLKIDKEIKKKSMLSNLQLLADGGDGGEGAGDGAGSEGDKGTGEGEERKFSQQELDDAIQKRLGREAKKYEKYKDLDDKELETYKQWKADQEKKKQEELSDLEKEKQAREKLEKEKDDIVAKANATLVRAAFLVGATEIPQDKREAAYKLTNLSTVTVENGEVDKDLLKAAVDEVIKEYPWLKDTTEKKKDVGGGAGNGGGQLSAEEVAANKAKERNKKDEQNKKSWW